MSTERVRRVPRLAFLESPIVTLTWVGVALVTTGFALLAFTWGRVAALLNVALQLPYVVSGGLTAVALVIVGCVLVVVAVKRQDAVERAREMSDLRDTLDELRAAIDAMNER